VKDTTKAQRRHDAARVKNNRSAHLVVRNMQSPKALGKNAATPAACSCHMCGNPRKFRGEITMQERKFLDVSREYLLGPDA